jgi:peptidoglycan hydrolase-like protein with peptidoglycan-binding domain
MGLQSELLRGDAKLEAAAVSDPAHIVPGARGPHVGKIQQALIELDDADIVQDSIYGPRTAAAVLAYKKKRNIINRGRQTTADNIVGTMTMASMDAEMLASEAPESLPTGPVRLESDPPPPPSPGGSPSRQSQFGIGAPSFVSGNQLVLGGLPLFGQIGPFSLTSNPRLEISLNGTGRVRVENGVGTIAETKDASVARVVNPDNPSEKPVIIRTNPQIVQVKGIARGRTDMICRTNASPSKILGTLPVWNGMPGRTLNVAFHYLDHIRLGTTLSVGDERAFVIKMNEIYLSQANIFFRKASAAIIQVTGLSTSIGLDRILIVSPNNFGPDWDKFLAKRNNDAMVNIYFVNDFEVNDPGLFLVTVFGIADMNKARATGRRDCMLRNKSIGAILPEPAVGNTVAHEVGHCLGLDHSTGSGELMNAGSSFGIPNSGTKITPAQAVAIHDHLDKFPK